jgi:hypothetical protein
MYGLAENTDLSFFTDKTLRQVRTGANENILYFDGDITLTITTDIAHRSGEVFTAIYKTAVPAAPMLIGLLDHSIVRATVKLPGTLILEFSNKETIEIYDTSTTYESYNITYNGKLIVV